MANSWLDDPEATQPEILAAQIRALLGGGAAGSPSGLPSAAGRVGPVARGSGMKVSGEDKKSALMEELKRVMGYLDPEETDKAYERAANSPGIKAQSNSLDQIEDAIRAQAEGTRGRGADPTSALSYLANYFTDGKAKYLPSEKSAKSSLIDYALKAQDDRRDLAKTIGDYVNRMRGGYTQTTDKQGSNTTFNITAADPNMRASGRPLASQLPDPRGFVKFFEQNSKDAKEAYANAQMAKKTLTSGSKVGFEAFKNFMARASGEKGPLSRDDLLRFQGSQAVSDRIDRAWTKYSSGQMTEADQDDMKILVDAYEAFHGSRLENIRDRFTDQYSEAFKISNSEAKRYLGERAKDDRAQKDSTPQMVDVISPEGKPGKIPKDKLDAAVKRGFKRVK